MRDTIVEKFAGPYDRGEFSPSVQKTLYESQLLILERVPEVGWSFKENTFYSRTHLTILFTAKTTSTFRFFKDQMGANVNVDFSFRWRRLRLLCPTSITSPLT